MHAPANHDCQKEWTQAKNKFDNLVLYDGGDDSQCTLSKKARWDEQNGHSACIQSWKLMRHARTDYLNQLAKSCDEAQKKKQQCAALSDQAALEKCQEEQARQANQAEQKLAALLQGAVDKLYEAQNKISSNVDQMQRDWQVVSAPKGSTAGTTARESVGNGVQAGGMAQVMRTYAKSGWTEPHEYQRFFPAMLTEQRQLTQAAGQFQDVAKGLTGGHRLATGELTRQSDITRERADGLGSLKDVNPNTLQGLANAAAKAGSSAQGAAPTRAAYGATAPSPSSFQGDFGASGHDTSGASSAGMPGGSVAGGTGPDPSTAPGRNPSSTAPPTGMKALQDRAGLYGSGGNPRSRGSSGSAGSRAATSESPRGAKAQAGGGEGSVASGAAPETEAPHACTGEGCTVEQGMGSGGAFAAGGQLGPTALMLEGDEKKALAELAGNHAASAEELSALGLQLESDGTHGSGAGGGGSHLAGSAIAGADSEALFQRVHGTHVRALRRGTVVLLHRKL